MPEDLLNDQTLIKGTVDLEQGSFIYRGGITDIINARGMICILTNGVKLWNGYFWSDFSGSVMSFASHSASISPGRKKGAYRVFVQHVGTFKLYPRNVRVPEMDPVTHIRLRPFASFVH